MSVRHLACSRRDANVAQIILWSMLRDSQLGGFKFRRKHCLAPYVVDFFCAQARLVVELAGESLDERKVHDLKRTIALRGRGLHVIRFRDMDVLKHPAAVVDVILEHAVHLAERLPRPRASGRVPERQFIHGSMGRSVEFSEAGVS